MSVGLCGLKPYTSSYRNKWEVRKNKHTIRSTLPKDAIINVVNKANISTSFIV
jgi:hypothetical protein